MQERKGFLIAFEGIDGCGKSTQATLLFRRLRSHRIPCAMVREPGSTPVAEAVRRILLHATNYQLFPETELLLYLAARADLYRREVLPELEKGAIVVSDRCFWSSVAYQGAGLGLGMEETHRLCLFATGGVEPDLVVLLDLPVEEALKRRKGALDRIEQRSNEYIEAVREGFLSQARLKPESSIVLDGLKGVEDLSAEIWQAVKKLLEKKGFSFD